MNSTCQTCGIVLNIDEHCKANEVNAGIQSLQAKMLKDRPTLSAYLRTQAACADKCSKECEAAGAIEQAAYRNGMWYAYRDIERMLEQNAFNPETPTI
jgi:hypothetical protein